MPYVTVNCIIVWSLLLQVQELGAERRRTEDLLYQMIPRAVADQLKTGNAVTPQMFPSATVFFSKIPDFNEISACSTPHQVVDLLNALYRSVVIVHYYSNYYYYYYFYSYYNYDHHHN